MVQLHVKRGDESQFLFNTTVDVQIDALSQQAAVIYNGRLKVERICSGIRLKEHVKHTLHTKTSYLKIQGLNTYLHSAHNTILCPLYCKLS